MTPPLQQSALGYMTALAQLQTVTSGTKLTITPYIGDNNDIVLEVAVELSDSIPKGRGSDLPVVTRRITNNTVTVRDGGTVAIAGLTENRKRSKQSKVPGLGDLPMVGSLFTNNDSDKGSREVAIFVTARLVPETSAFNPYGEPAAPREPSVGRSMMMESPGGAQDFRSQLAESLSRRSGSGY